MFNSTKLKKLPTLPAVNTAGYCYCQTFAYCNFITEIPENYLPVTALKEGCYNSMFSGCKALKTVPKDLLPSQTLGVYCYASMFSNCTALEKAPDLPATNLPRYCYYKMFANCFSLTEVPKMTINSAEGKSCMSMFENCYLLDVKETSVESEADWKFDIATPADEWSTSMISGVATYRACDTEPNQMYKVGKYDPYTIKMVADVDGEQYPTLFEALKKGIYKDGETPKTVKLIDDEYLFAEIETVEGTEEEPLFVNLDLNGRVIKFTLKTDTGSAISASYCSNLTITDSDPNFIHSGELEGLPAGGVITGGTYAGLTAYYGATILGGTITGNEAPWNQAGGIYLGDGILTVGGNTVVSGNIALPDGKTEKVGNVYLRNKVYSATYSMIGYFAISNDIPKNMLIHFSMEKPGRFTQGKVEKGDVKYFVSDDLNYRVAFNDNGTAYDTSDDYLELKEHALNAIEANVTDITLDGVYTEDEAVTIVTTLSPETDDIIVYACNSGLYKYLVYDDGWKDSGKNLTLNELRKMDGSILGDVVYHDHEWSFKADGASIVGTCADTDGLHGDEKTSTISLIAPVDSMYTGVGKEVTVLGTIDGVDCPEVVYYEGSKKLDSAPILPGDYTAKLTIEGKIAVLDYTITKRTWEEKPEVSVESIAVGKYDIEANPPTNSANVEEGFTYFYNVEKSNESGTEWTEENINSLPNGTYYIYGVAEESDYMDAVTTDAFKFTIHHEHDYSYEKVADNKIKVTCVAEPTYCNDGREITLKIDNAVYTGEAYVPYGVTKFQEEAGVDVNVVYKDADGETLEDAPINAGTYSAEFTVGGVTIAADFKILPVGIEKPEVKAQKVEYSGKDLCYSLTKSSDYKLTSGTGTEIGTYDVVVELTDPENTCWAGDGELGSEPITLSEGFEITKKQVTKPQSADYEYYYSGGNQKFIYTDSTDKYWYKLKNEANLVKSEVGSYKIIFELVDKTHSVWKNGDNSDLVYYFTINPLLIPVPVADPRSFYADGTEKKYTAFYELADCLYSFDGLFYNVTNNKRTEKGSQAVSVTPADGFAWDDGTGTAAKKFTFTLKEQNAYGSIYCLIDKRTGNYVDGYTYGSYLYDDENKSNEYVTTHYEPYMYTYPSNASYELYYTHDRNNLDCSKKWSDLTYTQIRFNGNYATYYIYAKVKAAGFKDYITSPYLVYIYKPTQNTTSAKSFACKVEQQSSFRIGKNTSIKTSKTVDSTENRAIRGRSFIGVEEAGSSILSDLAAGCSVVQWSNLSTGQAAKFVPGNENAIRNSFGVGSYGSYGALASSEGSNEGAKLDLSKLDLENIESFLPEDANLEDNMLFGDNIGLFEGVKKANDCVSELYSRLPGDIDTTNTYKVTFDKSILEEGKDDSVYLVEDVTAGEYVTEPKEPKFDGYRFLGWYYIPYESAEDVVERTLETDGVEWDFDRNLVADNITLYAM